MTVYHHLPVCLYLLSIAGIIAPSCRADDAAYNAVSQTVVSSLRGSAIAGEITHDENQQHQHQHQHRQRHRTLLQRPEHPCLLVRVETEYGVITANGQMIEGTFLEDVEEASGGISHELNCELFDDDVDKAGGRYFVPILGIDEGALDGIVSGETTFIADGAAFMDGALQVPGDAAVEFGALDDNDERRLQIQRRQRRQRRRRQLETTTVGTKRVLAVRVLGNDVDTTASSDRLSNNIFGTGGDSITMTSQFERCSHGKLQMKPFIGRTSTGAYVHNGVVEVSIPYTVNGADRRDIETEVQIAAKNKVGDLRQFDHVMLCLPPGSSNNKWIAYAYVNSWLTVYNDQWCQMLSTQVHELGHNLGLAHSGSGSVSYGDKSGMMGYSYFELDRPLQCYNPAKSFELGWYEDKAVTWNPIMQGTWFGTMIGVADYRNDQIQNGKVVVRIDRGGNDLYVGYNRQKDMNGGVMSNGDQVTIIEKDVGYSTSDFVAGLSPNSRRKFTNFRNSGKTLTVQFIETRSNKNGAFVAIYLDDCVYPSCCRGELCQPSPPPPPIVVPPINDDKDIKDVPIDNPVLFEIFPNPQKQKAEYIEIFNPTSNPINLMRFQICVNNGNSPEICVPITTMIWLESGEFFFLCRDEGYVTSNGMLPSGRVCHQDGNNDFHIRNRKADIILKRDTTPVDTVSIGNSKKYPGLAYARAGGCNKHDTPSCWAWVEPAMASVIMINRSGAIRNDDDDDDDKLFFAEEARVEIDDDGISFAEESGPEIALPPLDLNGGDARF